MSLKRTFNITPYSNMGIIQREMIIMIWNIFFHCDCWQSHLWILWQGSYIMIISTQFGHFHWTPVLFWYTCTFWFPIPVLPCFFYANICRLHRVGDRFCKQMWLILFNPDIKHLVLHQADFFFTFGLFIPIVSKCSDQYE